MTSNNVAHRRHGAPQFQTLFVGTTVGRKTTRRNPRPLEMGTKVEQKEGSPASQVLMAGSSTQFRGGCYHPAFNTLNFGLTEYPGHQVDLIALDPPLANNPPDLFRLASLGFTEIQRENLLMDAGATEVLQDVKKTLDGAAEVEVKPIHNFYHDGYCYQALQSSGGAFGEPILVEHRARYHRDRTTSSSSERQLELLHTLELTGALSDTSLKLVDRIFLCEWRKIVLGEYASRVEERMKDPNGPSLQAVTACSNISGDRTKAYFESPNPDAEELKREPGACLPGLP
ncbi:hypothetical protein DFP72DRAFT_855718 [Ephemerocybe angulata]|uniref:Uncharacterized protein n=1 Tax=Ephemerocybe angulata TaxID=980116 RepID=A0A8H6HHU5_9AGAR|nr:hypothetical protein DFP72DRAFT_855718 [Tulosesus angulatus]